MERDDGHEVVSALVTSPAEIDDQLQSGRVLAGRQTVFASATLSGSFARIDFRASDLGKAFLTGSFYGCQFSARPREK